MRLLGEWNWWLPARLERWSAPAPAVGAARWPRPSPAARPACGGLLSGADPRQPDRSPGPRPPCDAVADAARRPTRSRSSCPRRRAPRPADRVVVLHRPPAGSADGRRFGFEFVIFRAERGAFPVTWASHLALTDETGDGSCTTSARRSGRRWIDAARARRRPASTSRSRADRRTGVPAAARALAMPARWRRPARRQPIGGDAVARRRSAISASTCARRDAAAGPPRRRRLDRLRAGRRLLLLLAAAMDASGDVTLGDARSTSRAGLVRPPVGRLHRGRRRRLGLVRHQPRRRHGPDAVAGP